MASDNWNWTGARWWKFDFHTHTPESSDYLKGKQELIQEVTPKSWLLAYMKAEIDCVAVTDHNSGAWIDTLKSELTELEKKKPQGYRPLTIFPGVEISAQGGVHILALFDCSESSSTIDRLLGAVGYQGERGKRDEDTNGCTEKSVTEVIKIIAQSGGIPIPAHADREKGLFKLDGNSLKSVLDLPQITAIEICDPSSQKPQIYGERKIQWPEVVGSDSHNLRGGNAPGSKFTWVKMQEPTLEGVRLALLDGALSVKRFDAPDATDPNVHAHQIIESLTVKNAKHFGRKEPFECKFNPWMNAIIGGRGTGKSTLVEFLRIVLRRENELPDDLKKEFQKYRSVSVSKQESGLLKDDTELQVIYRKDGRRYRIGWNVRGDAPSIHDETSPDEWSEAPGEVAQRFPVRLFSQKQIFELAQDPNALLKIVDDAPRIRKREWDDQRKDMEAKFLSLRAKARSIQVKLGDEERLRGELADVKRKIELFERADYAETLKAYQRRQRQHTQIEQWRDSWANAGEKMRKFADELGPTDLDASLFEENNASDQELLAAVRKVGGNFGSLTDKLRTLSNEADKIADQWKKDQAGEVWRQAFETAKNEYEKLQRKLAAENVSNPQEYGELVQRRQILEESLRNLQSSRSGREKIIQEEKELLGELERHREELTKRRQEFLDDALQGNKYVRIEVIAYGDSENAEQTFRDLISRLTGFEKDIGTKGQGGLIGDLYDDEKSDRKEKLRSLREKLRNISNGDGSVSDERFRQHIKKLQPETLDRLDFWFPDDRLDVAYFDKQSSQKPKPIAQGSPGQKTAALLAFFLAYGEEPLILDQPEDDLDNQLIYDLIVEQLRTVKQKRQVIVVTHNANIVVNGDAEYVVSLDAGRGLTPERSSGSLQDSKVRDEICRVMEGGPTAFEKRYRRIMPKKRDVHV